MAICYQAPFKIFTPIPTANPKPIFRCNLSLPSRHSLLTIEPESLYTSVKAFALATVANLGPDFDFLGCAVDGLGDFVSLTVDPQVLPGEISISEISGDNNSKTEQKSSLELRRNRRHRGHEDARRTLHRHDWNRCALLDAR